MHIVSIGVLAATQFVVAVDKELDADPDPPGGVCRVFGLCRLGLFQLASGRIGWGESVKEGALDDRAVDRLIAAYRLNPVARPDRSPAGQRRGTDNVVERGQARPDHRGAGRRVARESRCWRSRSSARAPPASSPPPPRRTSSSGEQDVARHAHQPFEVRVSVLRLAVAGGRRDVSRGGGDGTLLGEIFGQLPVGFGLSVGVQGLQRGTTVGGGCGCELQGGVDGPGRWDDAQSRLRRGGGGDGILRRSPMAILLEGSGRGRGSDRRQTRDFAFHGLQIK